jgi:hypothetical protein
MSDCGFRSSGIKGCMTAKQDAKVSENPISFVSRVNTFCKNDPFSTYWVLKMKTIPSFDRLIFDYLQMQTHKLNILLTVHRNKAV